MSQIQVSDEPYGDPLEEVLRRLVRTLKPDRIYLFGSRARGDATHDSDYDLLVIVPHSAHPRYRRAQMAYRELFGIRIPVDVLILTRVEFERELPVLASLPATVAREGRLLYGA